jgi:hypothetical protein
MGLNRWAGWALAAVAVTAGATAEAGIITNVASVSSAEVDVFGPDTPVPNNDNTDALIFEGDGNPFVAIKALSLPGPIDIEFDVADSEGTTEYGILELVFNETGSAWSGYQFELGFGTGGSFIRSGNDGLDFDTPDKDPAPLSELLGSGTPFGALSHGDDLLRWSAGELPDGQGVGWLFGVDVPDAQGIPEYARHEGGYRFTLRQGSYESRPPDTHPVVPEPSSLWLVGLGLGGAGVVGWGRRQRKQRRK